jgi:predicted aminopeptidase
LLSGLSSGLFFTLSWYFSLGYYAQSLLGQLELILKRKPLYALIDWPGTPPELNRKLKLIIEIRRFAVQELGLPDNGSYSSYTPLDRPYVVWNVMATPELSFEPARWCFPFIGCQTYAGYFSEDKARHYASRLSSGGEDVYVSGVAAYSTLGWFSDPVPSTLLRWDDAQLVNYVIHELAHQILYVPGDTAFNEAFAVAVAKHGVRRWLERNATPLDVAEFQAATEREREFATLIMETRQRLVSLYRQAISPQNMRGNKALILKEMKLKYAALRSKWGGFRGYDSFMNEGLNNAKLSSVVTYQEHARAFDHLFDATSGRFHEIYRIATQLGNMDYRERTACLADLARGTAAACGSLEASNNAGVRTPDSEA